MAAAHPDKKVDPIKARSTDNQVKSGDTDTILDLPFRHDRE
ncbi:hypothetical protein OG455_21305 [Kitasatospora sp. NBC_01287]|nr:hypothetical protein [Kitasatospora sp. NBC_01287]MCX4748021.1 hypothetical protein [Kitasatospora sp. NBC_01287]